MSILPDTAQAQGCGRPSNWPSYTVQLSDTLFSLAQRTGTSVQQIQTANCLAGTLIFAGQILYLPFIPAPQAGTSEGGTPATIWTPKVGRPGNYEIEPSPSAGLPNTTFTFSVNRYASNELVHVTIRSVNRVLVQDEMLPADQDGKLTWHYDSPADAKPGRYNVFADGTITDAHGSGSFSITQPPATSYP